MSHTEIGILVNAETHSDAVAQADAHMVNIIDELGDYYDYHVRRVIQGKVKAFRKELANILKARRAHLRKLREWAESCAVPVASKRRWRIHRLMSVDGQLVFGNSYYHSKLSYTGVITNRDLQAVKADPKRHWLVFFDYHN